MKPSDVLQTIAFAALAVSAAQAESPGTETISSVVSFADLNLHSPRGVAQLRARIRAAAREVCGSADRYNLRTVFQVRACTTEAVARALASIDTRAPGSLVSSP